MLNHLNSFESYIRQRVTVISVITVITMLPNGSHQVTALPSESAQAPRRSFKVWRYKANQSDTFTETLTSNRFQAAFVGIVWTWITLLTDIPLWRIGEGPAHQCSPASAKTDRTSWSKDVKSQQLKQTNAMSIVKLLCVSIYIHDLNIIGRSSCSVSDQKESLPLSSSHAKGDIVIADQKRGGPKTQPPRINKRRMLEHNLNTAILWTLSGREEGTTHANVRFEPRTAPKCSSAQLRWALENLESSNALSKSHRSPRDWLCFGLPSDEHFRQRSAIALRSTPACTM